MHPNPAGEQHEEQERIHVEMLKKEVRTIGEKWDSLLGKENYVIDKEEKIAITRHATASPQEEDWVDELEGRLQGIYTELKGIKERT